ncbi:MAG: FAD-dependent oxidoreductase, partial [Candidatus Eisenbacteria sp.]|nr:FAD-dependent oxidoreductase [Candidatus Eisenbacteria bacterium]
LAENHVKNNGANVITGNALAEFLGENGKLTGVKLQDGTELQCELAVVAIGVRPNTSLAEEAGIRIGKTRGIEVNSHMQTSDPDIYAAGDCVETTHLITGEKTLAPLGDLANLEGRVAGQNVILGNKATFPGTIKTGICKVFDYTAGSTGLSEGEARKEGSRNVIATICSGLDKPNFMGGKLVVLKMVADAETGRILGVQGVGPGDVSKRIATAAFAIQQKATVSDMVNADLPYAPPFSLALDLLIATAHVLENKMLGRMKGISTVEVKKKIDGGEDVFFIDTRGPDEFEEMRLGIGETLIPLGALRTRLKELPQEKDKEIIAYCKISLRGYEAACFLEANGWSNVKVMEGGIMAWPYAREK